MANATMGIEKFCRINYTTWRNGQALRRKMREYLREKDTKVLKKELRDPTRDKNEKGVQLICKADEKPELWILNANGYAKEARTVIGDNLVKEEWGPESCWERGGVMHTADLDPGGIEQFLPLHADLCKIVDQFFYTQATPDVV
jgi:hypothetical protein